MLIAAHTLGCKLNFAETSDLLRRLVEYDDNGLLIREGFYKDGFRHGAYRFFEDNHLTIDETWNHGTLSDRRVRLLTPDTEFVSIFDIACLAPQGKAKVVVYLKDGSKRVSHESSEALYDRLGSEHFAYANRKSRILVAMNCVQGSSKDAEGRDILILEPQPDFVIFPDEDGLKMVRSRQYEEDSPLEQLIRDKEK